MDDLLLKLLEALIIVLPILFANWSSRRKKEKKDNELRQQDAIKRKERQRQTDEHQRRVYRRNIEKVYDGIINNPERKISREYYKGVEEDFCAYKELGGNSYIETLMEEIREHYKKQT